MSNTIFNDGPFKQLSQEKPQQEAVQKEMSALEKAQAEANLRKLEAEAQVNKEADQALETILTASLANDEKVRSDLSNEIDKLGYDMETQVADEITKGGSQLMKRQLKSLKSGASEGFAGEAVKSSMALKKIDPEKLGGWRSWSFLRHIPVVGYNVEKYLTEYKSVESVISEMFEQIANHGKAVEEDIVALKEERNRLSGHIASFEQKAQFLKRLTEQLKASIPNVQDEKQKEFLTLGVYQPLLERHNAILNMIAVTRVAITNMGLVIEHNRKVVRECQNANTVVRVRVTNAAVVAVAQEQTNDAMQAVREVTDFANKADETVQKNLQNMQKNLEGIDKEKANEAMRIAKNVESMKQTISALKDMKAKSIPLLSKAGEDMEKMLEVLKTINQDQAKQEEIDSKF